MLITEKDIDQAFDASLEIIQSFERLSRNLVIEEKAEIYFKLGLIAGTLSRCKDLVK